MTEIGILLGNSKQNLCNANKLLNGIPIPQEKNQPSSFPNRRKEKFQNPRNGIEI
jgi:hypothetical protein